MVPDAWIQQGYFLDAIYTRPRENTITPLSAGVLSCLAERPTLLSRWAKGKKLSVLPQKRLAAASQVDSLYRLV